MATSNLTTSQQLTSKLCMCTSNSVSLVFLVLDHATLMIIISMICKLLFLLLVLLYLASASFICDVACLIKSNLVRQVTFFWLCVLTIIWHSINKVLQHWVWKWLPWTPLNNLFYLNMHQSPMKYTCHWFVMEQIMLKEMRWKWCARNQIDYQVLLFL